MTEKTFWLRLAAITAGALIVLAGLFWLAPPAKMHGIFMVATVALFVLVCTGLFFAGKSAASSTSKLAFNNLVSASVFGKMVLAIAVLFVYKQVAKPTNEWFVGIFLFIYVVFTVFEVWFMTQLARNKP